MMAFKRRRPSGARLGPAKWRRYRQRAGCGLTDPNGQLLTDNNGVKLCEGE